MCDDGVASYNQKELGAVQQRTKGETTQSQKALQEYLRSFFHDLGVAVDGGVLLEEE